MFQEKSGYVLKCIFPGCSKPVSENNLASGHATCSPECSKRFVATFGRSDLNHIKAYLRSIVYCTPDQAHAQKRGMAAFGLPSPTGMVSPLFMPVMEQAGARFNIMEEAYDQADTPEGWTAFEHVFRTLAGGNFPADHVLVCYKDKRNPKYPRHYAKNC